MKATDRPVDLKVQKSFFSRDQPVDLEAWGLFSFFKIRPVDRELRLSHFDKREIFFNTGR